jgi:hypothetical protein
LLDDSLASPPPGVPDYRAANDPVQSCATCSFNAAGFCTKFNFVTKSANLCDAWDAQTITENAGQPNVQNGRVPGGRYQPPGPQAGQPDLERRFYPVADGAAPLPDQSAT